jgi:UDP-2,3-diacylglucosamine pyrophosphatase LpxH
MMLCLHLAVAQEAGTQAQPVASPKAQTPTTYYFISDMHIGGDGGLDHCAFEGELIAFLRDIANGPSPSELIIVGDALGLWELTEARGDTKVQRIASTHRDLFDLFRETGRRVRITLLPGNHDYELACIPAYKQQLAEYNIDLEPKTHITRTVAGRTVWIEHGNQHDEFNTFPDFGDRYGLPSGYFITTSTVAAAARSAEVGRSPWLNDLESVYPNEEIPFWIWSNYFHRDMGLVLRWLLLPFLLLFGVSVIVFAGRALEAAGILRTKIFHMELKSRFGLTGRLVDWVLWVNGVVITFLLVLAVPLWLLARDVRSALHRYGIDTSEGLNVQKDARYLAAARAVFEKDPSVALYIYGHTHAVSVRAIGPRYVINTGTWLKRLERVRAHFRLMPDVYVPSYRLNYFTISQKGNDLCVRYRIMPKEAPDDLTLVQRVMILGRRPPRDREKIPEELLVRQGVE